MTAGRVCESEIDNQVLVGPPEPVLERYGSWADCGLTGFHMSSGQPEDMELMAESSELSLVRCAQIGPELHAERATSEWRSIRKGDADALG